MTTGRKAWLDEWSDNEHQYRTIHIGKCAPDRKGATQGVFLTTAELDTLVAAAEARGAIPQKLNELEISDACLSYDHGYGLLEGEDKELLRFQCKEWYHALRKTVCEPTLAMEAAAQAHTQRQRDEGCNEGVEASAAEVVHQMGSSCAIDEAVLALRKETP